MPAATKVQSKQAITAVQAEAAVYTPVKGLRLCRIFWIFLITAFLGCFIETAFMLLTRGELQNRSGVLYGQFSLVWGMGAVLFTLCFYRLQELRSFWLFWGGFLMGALYEYACSWLQEVLFGACFWDYSHLPLNINGRVNLVFSAFWGLAAVVWVRMLYPALVRLINKIPTDLVRPLTRFVAILMASNILVTAAALGRMNTRQRGLPPANAIEAFLDRHYPDQRLHESFSTLVYVGTDEARAAAGLGAARDIPK